MSANGRARFLGYDDVDNVWTTSGGGVVKVNIPWNGDGEKQKTIGGGGESGRGSSGAGNDDSIVVEVGRESIVSAAGCCGGCCSRD